MGAHLLYMERVEEESAAVMEDTSNSRLRNTCCCFNFPCFKSRQSSTAGLPWWNRIQSQNRWWTPAVTAFRRVREWSEIVAGPNWKTFIRRFNRNKSNNAHGKFQYDPLSYSLNFEENCNLDHDNDFSGFRDFSTKYAPCKSSTTAATPLVGVRGRDVAALA
ncbi:uncharacterized protein LOC123206529 [Mangifera indica]|uniref:uncharacterized protein LOC123206529 n=1 Tax=Mangifera indica TaxID=29780 RepID=UPI001CF9DE73|nr:uncharacterized protein LOC123206529 [Mangifera indica]